MHIRLIDIRHRLTHTANLFGFHFALHLEPAVYGFAEWLSGDYRGGYWNFYSLNNGGFYMAPSEDRFFHVACENGFEGTMSADAFGITVCLYAYSHLSFGIAVADTFAEQFHCLRDYALDHPEAGAILGAID